MKVLIVLLCALANGCLAMNPGGQVEKALKQKQEVRWTHEDDLSVVTEGTHEAEWMLATGEIKMKMGEDGNMVVDHVASSFSQLLWSKPHAGAAASAAAMAFQASTEQVKAMSASFDKMVALIASAVAPVPPIPKPKPELPIEIPFPFPGVP